jgi:hypothetical protein
MPFSDKHNHNIANISGSKYKCYVTRFVESVKKWQGNTPDQNVAMRGGARRLGGGGGFVLEDM